MTNALKQTTTMTNFFVSTDIAVLTRPDLYN